MTTEIVGFGAGFLIAVLTAPVGVSGAVFLLPVQLSILAVPSPAVTPTNLLFNVVSIPGSLLRYRKRGRLHSPLTMLLLLGTLPGVIVGSVIRVFAVPGPRIFRLLIAALMLPLGLWLLVRTLRPHRARTTTTLSDRAITVTALTVGVVGGIYGIGGGSILSPILVGCGFAVADVAPAALASTFLTSIVGAGTYAVLGVVTRSGDISPDWLLGLTCGLGGLLGGYVGAHLQFRMPAAALQLLLGLLAVLLALVYAFQAVRQ